jgi:hypothetical protein
MKKFVWLLTLIGFSCTSSLYDSLGMKDIYPDSKAPVAASFAVENGVSLSWQADPAADSYRVYRDTAPDGDFTLKVYEGEGLSFTDTGLTADQFYYYKLSKLQGWKEFGKSAAVAAYVSQVRRDSYEDNDSRERATLLKNPVSCSIWYFQDAYQNSVSDTDWFYIDVEAGMNQTAAFENFSNIGNGDLLYSVNGDNPKTVISEQEVSLTNKEQKTQRFYIQVYPSKSKFAGDPGLPGGKFASYTLKRISLTSNGG